jgi:hypothetical protein
MQPVLEPKKEKIAANVFRSVAKKELAPLKRILDALRDRDWDKLSKLDDVKLPSIEDLLMQQQSSSVEIASKEGDASSKGTTGKSSQADSAPVTESFSGTFPSIPKELIFLKSVLTEDAKDGQGDPEKTHEALRLAGWIKPANEFWSNVRP